MPPPRRRLAAAGLPLAAFGLSLGGSVQESAEGRRIVVPKLWDAKEMEGWSTPVAGLGLPPTYASEEEYYAAPVDNLRTYPVYHPDREPEGYREALLRAGPRPLIEPHRLVTQADWIEAGRRVFEELDTPASRSDDPRVIEHFTSARAIDAWRDEQHDVVDAEGVLLDYRWVVVEGPRLQLSFSSCSGCHTRLMPDGSLLPGAPCNFDLSGAPAVQLMLDQFRLDPAASAGEELYQQYGVPWLEHDLHAPLRAMGEEELERVVFADTGAPPGTTFDRFGGSPFFTTRMADLRGIRDRRWLDATATHKNRGTADIARYGLVVEYAETRAFGPHRIFPPGTKPPVRPPDEALYALALYVESLDVPASPHPFDEDARRGRELFEREGCVKCHTPPLYTNNKLVAAPGFYPPEDAATRWGLDVSTRRVGTDPGLALGTRKGTGYYRIPSLRGVWYRGLYGHSGWVTSLEEWFDPARLDDGYVPKGWRGPGVEQRAVPGHEFGLDLERDEKRALIAFLRTL